MTKHSAPPKQFPKTRQAYMDNGHYGQLRRILTMLEYILTNPSLNFEERAFIEYSLSQLRIIHSNWLPNRQDYRDQM